MFHSINGNVRKRIRECIAVGIIVLSMPAFIPVHAQVGMVRINEFMALNNATLQDADGDYTDWIELYNPSSSTVNLDGWSLTDDKENRRKWVIPDIDLPAGGYIVVFASGKDRALPGAELHANFQLSGAGEYLALCDGSGSVVTEFDPSYPVQVSNRSFAFTDGIFLETSIPTPSGLNCFPASQPTPAPAFSRCRGFYDTPIEVNIGSELSTAQIYYTTDGSAPGEGHGDLYTSPVRVTTTTVLRAVAVQSGFIPSTISTSTFIFPDDVVNQPNNPPGYPALWGPYTALPDTAIADYEMDPEIITNPMYAGQMRESLLSIPTMSIVTDKDNLFLRSTDPEKGGIYIYTGPPGNGDVPQLGIDWARPVSIEYFNRDGSFDIQADCELKIHGGHSRRPEKSPKHSFRLTFKSAYGASKLVFPLFGEDATSSFNSLILRAGYGNTWLHMSSGERNHTQLIHDLWAKDTQHAMGQPSGHGNFVHLYINGMYWGIYNPTERIDKDFATAYLHGDADEYDVIKDYTEVVDGNIAAWNTLVILANSGLSDNANYQRIQGKNPDGSDNPAFPAYLDVLNFIDYMILNYYGANWDWDHHNWIAVRNRVLPDKGFRFFIWDAEHICENVSSNVLSKNTDRHPTGIFRRLCENEDFRRLFADRVQFHCFNGGVFTPAVAADRWMSRAGEIDPAILAESARWGDYRRDVHPYAAGPFSLYDREDWLDERSFLIDEYFPDRTGVFINQLRQEGLFPTVDAPQFMINGGHVVRRDVSLLDTLTMTVPAGEIYFTTDGSDPLSAGGLSPAAKKYTGRIVLDQTTHFKSRASLDSEWSALNETVLVMAPEIHDVKVTEIHYHPSPTDSMADREFEFIELKNVGAAPLDLTGARFVEGISYTFPVYTTIEPAEFIILASDGIHFRERYGFAPFGVYEGALDNGGEQIVLLSGGNDTMLSVRYNDKDPWPPATDGGGYSLVPKDCDPQGDQCDPAGWRASSAVSGSPGFDDPQTTQMTNDCDGGIPSDVCLDQNYPNPFNPATRISYSLPDPGPVTLVVYNILGEQVRVLVNSYQRSGFHSVDVDGEGLASGVYFYRLKAGDNLPVMRKMILLR